MSDHLTICGARGPLSPEARAEIEAFSKHLSQHRGQTVEGCHFCAERSKRHTPSSERQESEL